MQKLVFYIGCNDKETLQQELTHNEFIKVFDSVFDNYTVMQAQGRYTMQELNTVITENTYIITIFNVKPFTTNQITNICKYLKNNLNQETILYTNEYVNAAFV